MAQFEQLLSIQHEPEQSFEIIERTSARQPESIDESDENCDAEYNTFKRKLDGNLKYFRLNGIKPKGFFLSGNILLHTKREWQHVLSLCKLPN